MLAARLGGAGQEKPDGKASLEEGRQIEVQRGRKCLGCMESEEYMFVKQLSVFMENREVRLEKAAEVLKKHGINILSLSMADTTEYGMLRMVVSDPELAKTALRENGFSAMLTDVLAVRLEDQVGELHKLTHILCGKGLNVEYMYALASADRRAMIVKASDGAAAAEAVLGGGLTLYTGEEMCG